MKSALLGYTGFVGNSISSQASFDDKYNTKNISSIREKKYDLIVCAAAPGVKWLANQNPEKDWLSISTLIDHLKTIKVNRFVLISTVDVYPIPIKVDEKTPINPERNTPYGKHRFLLERFITQTFPQHTIVRLPGLFGEGIKKNVIYDFIHNNLIEKIHPQSQFQFYNLKHLWDDIQIVLQSNTDLINMVTEPLTAHEIYEATFGRPLLNKLDALPAVYDVRSIHATLYGKNRYMANKQTILREITAFISAQRANLLHKSKVLL